MKGLPFTVHFAIRFPLTSHPYASGTDVVPSLPVCLVMCAVLAFALLEGGTWVSPSAYFVSLLLWCGLVQLSCGLVQPSLLAVAAWHKLYFSSPHTPMRSALAPPCGESAWVSSTLSSNLYVVHLPSGRTGRRYGHMLGLSPQQTAS